MIKLFVVFGICVLALAVICMVVIVLVDDCLYWADKENNHFCESQGRYPPDDRDSRNI